MSRSYDTLLIGVDTNIEHDYCSDGCTEDGCIQDDNGYENSIMIFTRLDPWGHARTQLGFIVALLNFE